MNVLNLALAAFYLCALAPPKIKLSMGPTFIENGKTATLPTCHVTGFPVPRITWSKLVGQTEPKPVKGGENGTLFFINVQRHHSGTYICTATNSLARITKTTQLSVMVVPRFIVKPPVVVSIILGKSSAVKCTATGSPMPSITWQRIGGALPASWTTQSNNSGGVLVVSKAKLTDNGRYKCIATSNPLKSETAFRIQVVRKSGESIIVISFFFVLFYS